MTFDLESSMIAQPSVLLTPGSTGMLVVRLVERTVGAAEVPALHVAVMPSVFDGVYVLDGCVQAFRRELALVVGDMQRRGVDFQPAITFGDGEFRLFAEITDHRHLRGVIHETAAVGPFETGRARP